MNPGPGEPAVKPAVMAPEELEAIADPAVLLDRAWALEPEMRLAERLATLDRLERVLDTDDPPAPPTRSWRLELMAERAIHAALDNRLPDSTALSDAVLAQAGDDLQIARVRALAARGRVLAWTGTEHATRQADQVLLEVIEGCRQLGNRDWLGFHLFWRGNGIFFQHGELSRARELIAEGLEVLGPDSPRRARILTFYAEVLMAFGDWPEADRVLEESLGRAERDGDPSSVAYAAWSRARLASLRGDPQTTERLIREAERDSGNWFDISTGLTFLADAAEMLDRVGLSDQANGYLARATERDQSGTDEFVLQARATLLARSGEPTLALNALQELVRGDWLEKRLVWRHSLLTAWATFRAGRHGAGELAARAFAQADQSGGPRVAVAGEPELTAALAPLAESAGSREARELILNGRELLIRLFGEPRVTRADGSVLELPGGMPGELVRMLALHEHGLPIDVVLETFFPEASPQSGRQRMRQILVRLKAAVGELVIRDGETLKLVPAWVDIREFLLASARVQGAQGARAAQLAYAALALRSGPPLAADRYAPWAENLREQVEYRYLNLLDTIVIEANARGSHQEALTALESAFAEDPTDTARHSAILEHLLALGRRQTAEHMARRVGIFLPE